jgi:hypothetical protein
VLWWWLPGVCIDGLELRLFADLLFRDGEFIAAGQRGELRVGQRTTAGRKAAGDKSFHGSNSNFLFWGRHWADPGQCEILAISVRENPCEYRQKALDIRQKNWFSGWPRPDRY